MSDLKDIRIIVAGAKTGGHLYPAVAVGEALAAVGADVTLVTSGEAIEGLVLAESVLKRETLHVGMIKGMGGWRKVKGLATIPAGLIRAWRLLTKLRPQVALGFGGYTTGPLLLVAAMRGIPIAICEENSVPGFTNRVLSRFADRIFVAFEATAQCFDHRKVVLTGNPVRPEILALPAKTSCGDHRRILVFGGSQGSRFLNERIPAVLAELGRQVPGIEVIHQTGRGNGPAVTAAYAALGLAADVKEYLSPMADAYGWADFVIARSGAGTVSEIAAVGIPALFVPFAAAADNHQVANARPLVEGGAALMVEERDFAASDVVQRLAMTLGNAQALEAMASVSRSIGRRDAVAHMVASVEECVKR